jgi:hypothetical protein
MKTLLYLLSIFALALPSRASEKAPRVETPAQQEEHFVSLHAIIVDGDGCARSPIVKGSSGNFSYSCSRRPMPGEGREEMRKDSKVNDGFVHYLNTIFDEIAHSKGGPPKHIIIYIHGGMNFLNDGMFPGSIHHAAELAHHFERKDGTYVDDTYVISICWQSDPFATLSDHLFVVTDGRNEPITPWLSPLTLLQDIGEMVARAPLSTLKLGRNDVQSAFASSDIRFRQARDRQVKLWKNGKPDDYIAKVDSSMGGDNHSEIASIGDFFSWAASLPPRLVTGAIVEGVGRHCWQMMLRRTRTMFSRETSYKDQEGAVARFFHDAEERPLKQNNGIYPGDISLIGHSMGAIVACHILANQMPRAQSKGILFKNIVFMGAACTSRDYDNFVVPYLSAWNEKCPETTPRDEQWPQFYNLCLDPGAERSEKPFVFFGIFEWVPRGSLLVWLDSILDQPASEQDRMLGRWDNAVLTMSAAPVKIGGDLGDSAHKEYTKILKNNFFKTMLYSPCYNEKVQNLVHLKTFGRDRPAGVSKPDWAKPFYGKVPFFDKPTPEQQAALKYASTPRDPLKYTTLAGQKASSRNVAEPTHHGDFSRYSTTDSTNVNNPNFAFWKEQFWKPE